MRLFLLFCKPKVDQFDPLTFILNYAKIDIRYRKQGGMSALPGIGHWKGKKGGINVVKRQEVFRGHLEECFKHLGTTLGSRMPKGSPGVRQIKESIAGFCGVTVDTVTRWQKGRLFPIGEILIRLMCYLDLVGYRVIELERMPRFRRGFVELVGFGLLSGQEVAEFLGYATPRSLYRVLQGQCGVSEDRKQQMWDEWKKRREEIERKKEELREKYPVDLTEAITVQASRRPAIVSIAEALLVMLEEEPPEKLSGLQESPDTIRQLSARLEALDQSAKDQKGGGQWATLATKQLSKRSTMRDHMVLMPWRGLCNWVQSLSH